MSAEPGNVQANSGGWRRLAATLAVWLLLLAAALLLLAGRYDWSTDVRSFAVRGYLSSAYLLVIVLPTLHYLVRLLIGSKWLARVSTGLTVLVFTLPYHWLGLKAWHYCQDRPAYWRWSDDGQPPPQLAWLPQVLGSIPYEAVFFGGLVAVAVLLAWGHAAAARRLPSAEHARQRGRAWLFLGLFLLILGQTWLHMSMRAPMTYMRHFNTRSQKDAWYHDYLFENGQGAVNEDFPHWHDLEVHFTDEPRPTSTMLIRRPLLFYLSVQVGYFINPYYVWLVLNVAIWLLAAAATYGLACRLWDARVGAYAALLVASGPGFILYAAQPMAYLAGYALLIICVYICERLLVAPERPGWPHVLATGAVLGMAMLSYDIYPLLAVLPIYVLARRRSWLSAVRIVAGLVLAGAFYAGFVAVQQHWVHIELDERNSRFLGEAVEKIRELITTSDVGNWFLLTSNGLAIFAANLFRAFLIVPIVLAVLGLCFRRTGDRAGVGLLLIVPALGTFAFLYYGQVWFAALPRFAYAAYPGVYLLAALFLAWMRDRLAERVPRGVAEALPLVVLLLIIVLNNLDVFGLPQLYFPIVYGHSNGAWSLIHP
ncbi:MAG: hypothetical protein PVJ57_22875 [Phycisphaerae bacterium]